MSSKSIVYASEGHALHTFALDPASGALTLRSSVTLPELVQYAAFDAERRLLYASASDRDRRHLIVALAIDRATGALTLHGAPVVPELGRVVHLSVDRSAEHLVLAHPLCGQLSVLALQGDGTLGRPVAQGGAVEGGFFTHQAKLDPAGTGVVACGMGADATDGAPESPGLLTAFRYRRGILTRTGRVTLAPGLGPRHLDYSRDRVYVSVERGNCVAVFDYAEGVLGSAPRFLVSTLLDPSRVRPAQRAGAIRLHPNGRWLYVTNRANATVPMGAGGERCVFAGGENDVTLFDVDLRTGEPQVRGHFSTGGIEPRTFTIDPTGTFLVVANHSALEESRPDGRIARVPRSWVVFRIGDDGRLGLLQKVDRAVADLFWSGSIALP